MFLTPIPALIFHYFVAGLKSPQQASENESGSKDSPSVSSYRTNKLYKIIAYAEKILGYIFILKLSNEINKRN